MVWVEDITFNSLLRKSLNLSITREVDVHNLVSVVANVKLLVCPHVVLLLPVVPLLHVPHYAPHRQVVDVHLVPIVVLDSVQKGSIGLVVQFDGAVIGLTDVLQEGHLQSDELELHHKRLNYWLIVFLLVPVERAWAFLSQLGYSSIRPILRSHTYVRCSTINTPGEGYNNKNDDQKTASSHIAMRLDPLH